jgi:hypothetical protein
MPLEILHLALMLFRRSTGFEGSEVAAFARFRIDFAGIEPVFAGLQFSDHVEHRVLTKPLGNNLATRPLVPVGLIALSLALPCRIA